MPNADANYAELSYGIESTLNQIPSNALVLRNLPFTAEALSHAKTTEVSAEIRPDRNVQDLIETGVDVTGSHDFEVSDAEYLMKDILPAALFDNGVKAFATGILTFTAQPTALDTVTIGVKTYKFVSSLTGAANEVLIGAALIGGTGTLANFVAAVNQGAGAGTAYGTGTLVNQDAAATASSTTTITATARAAGVDANAVVTTEAGTNTSWAAATLAGGTDSSLHTGIALGDDIVVSAVSASESLLQATSAATGLKFGRAVAFNDLLAANARQGAIVSAIDDTAKTANVRPSIGAVGTIQSTATYGYREIKNGTQRHSFFIEKFFTDLAQAVGFGGMMIDELDLDITARKLITGTIKWVGVQTYTSVEFGVAARIPGSGNVLSASGQVGAIELGDLSAQVQSVKLTIKNNLRGQDIVSSKFVGGIGVGRFEVTGTVAVYFSDISIYNAMIDHDSLKLLVGVCLDSYALAFYMPNIKLAKGDPAVTAVNTDVMLSLDFQALYDATEDATLVISASSPAALT